MFEFFQSLLKPIYYIQNHSPPTADCLFCHRSSSDYLRAVPCELRECHNWCPTCGLPIACLNNALRLISRHAGGLPLALPPPLFWDPSRADYHLRTWPTTTIRITFNWTATAAQLSILKNETLLLVSQITHNRPRRLVWRDFAQRCHQSGGLRRGPANYSSLKTVILDTVK